jgi:hypothetical protein
MGSPYTEIYSIGEDHFAEFDGRLEAVKSSYSLSAWHGFLSQYDYYPDDIVKELVDRGVVVDGVEPDWFEEALVAVLKGAFIKGCPKTRTEPNLIQDMWFFRYEWVQTLHSVCATPEEHFQGYLLRMLLFDRYMLNSAMKKLKDGRLPGPLPGRKKWYKWCLPRGLPFPLPARLPLLDRRRVAPRPRPDGTARTCVGRRGDSRTLLSGTAGRVLDRTGRPRTHGRVPSRSRGSLPLPLCDRIWDVSGRRLPG